MNQALKMFAWCAMMVFTLAAGTALATQVRGGATPLLIAARVIFPILLAGSVVLLLWTKYRPDRVPDHLKALFPKHRYECAGLSLALDIEAVDEVAFLNVYFQNRFERPCKAVISLAPTTLLKRPIMTQTVFNVPIECPGAGFGCARIAIPVPPKHQGKKKSFKLAAGVEFPERRGRELLFGAGTLLSNQAGRDASLAAGTVLFLILGLAAGMLLFFRAGAEPRSIRLRYPDGVLESPPDGSKPEQEILWEPGDEIAEDGVVGSLHAGEAGNNHFREAA